MSTDVRQRTDLLVELVSRDLRLRYRGSVLGFLWSQSAPLVTLLIITVVFTRIVDTGQDHYPTFVLAGLLPWAWTSGAMPGAADSVLEGRDLVMQPRFPRILLPVGVVGTHGLHLVFSLPLLALTAVLDTGRLPWSTVFLPIPIALQALVLLGPALIVASLNVRWRDIRHIIGVALLPLFWATPIFYDRTALPDPLADAMRLNPLTGVTESYRATVLMGRAPSIAEIAWPVGIGVLLLAVGLWLFQRRAPHFLESL